MEKHAQTGEEKIGEVRGEVRGCLDLDDKRQWTAPDRRQQFLAGLDRAFGPAMLLRLEAVHVHRQFGGRDYVREENKFPTGELGAVTQVEIFRERVVLPAARFVDARPAPEPGGAVEIEEASAAAARRLFEKQMAVEKHRLDASEERVAAIQMSPARLDHADFRVGEKMDGALEQVRLRNEIGIQDADELALRGSQTSLKRARLE